MLTILNTDLISVGVAIAASFLLSFVIFYQNPKSSTSKFFLFFAIANAGWSFFNFLNYRVTDPILILWFIRLVMFFAVLQVFSFFLLMFSFPDDSPKFPKWFYNILPTVVVFTALLTLTPFVFSGLKSVENSGSVSQPIVGPGIGIFAFVAISLVIWGVTLLIKKVRNATLKEKAPFRYLLAGVIIMFSFIILLNFIFPSLFNNTRFIPLSAVFTFPFVVCTAIALFKYQLLNVKLISTELLVFALAVAILFEVVLSNDFTTMAFRFALFLLVLGVGILLIQSVLREVKQREMLEVLTKQLEDANEKLKALDKARSEFITIASHQLRTPPATIKWYLSSILDGDYGKLKTEQKEILEKTNRTNNSLISLVDDMLNVSRIERGKMEFLFQPANLLDLAKITFEQLEPMAKEKGLTLTFKIPKGKFPEIMADKEKVRQVMNNMIDNAIKYTKAGSVNISLRAENGQIIFQTQDTGKGIAPEEADSIFEKFSRGKESVKQSAGLGLGLYVAKIIIGQHKGKIWAESPGPGKGSSFIFSLPINNDLKETTLVDLTKNQG